MNARPRIALYQPYPHTFGGMHAIVLQLAAALPAFGYDPLVITPEEGSFAARLRDERIPCLVSDPGRAWHVYGRGAHGASYLWSPRRLASLVAYWRRLSRELRAHGVSILHCNDYRGVMLAAPAGRRAGIPTLWHMHGYVASRAANLAAALLTPWKVPVSVGMLDYLKLPRWMLRRCHVIGNGVEARSGADGGERVSSPSAPHRSGNFAPPVVLAVGTLHPRKGYETLVRAFQRVRRKIPGAECWIAGGDFADGSHGRELRNLAARLGLMDSVKFLGPRNDVGDLLRQAALMAIPSRIEVFGLVAVEAMLAGKPVVASRTGGLRDIVADRETGLLVEPGNVPAMADAMVEVLADPVRGQRLGDAGRQRALTMFTVERMLAGFADFYDRLLGVPVQRHPDPMLPQASAPSTAVWRGDLVPARHSIQSPRSAGTAAQKISP